MEWCQGVGGNCRHQQNSITSKKFFNQKNFGAGGAKAEPEKFGHLATHKKFGRMKEKGKTPRCGRQEFATNAIWRHDSKF
jgi:hypothetical protein